MKQILLKGNLIKFLLKSNKFSMFLLFIEIFVKNEFLLLIILLKSSSFKLKSFFFVYKKFEFF